MVIDAVNPNLLFKITTTAPEVEEIQSNININKAPGVDNLPGNILCTCAKELSVPLARLFNLSLRTGKMSTLWKSANITPIHKEDNRELVTNYKSTFLLSIPAKCLERIVCSAINDHISPFLTEWQHGFVKGRSFETQLILTHHQWAVALVEGRQVDVAFLDFAKAFERVKHSVLLQKLCKFGISGSLLHWCERFLSNRHQRVVLDGVSSSWCNVPSGVHQGSLSVTFLKLFFLAT